MYGFNPFGNYKRKFDLKKYNGADILRPANAASPQDLQRQQTDITRPSTPVSLPGHLFIPEGAQSIDMRRVCKVGAGTSADVILFTALPGTTTRFLAYGIFNDGENAADFSFLPTVNGARVFPFHGDPQDNFKMNLGLAPDLGDEAMIKCQLALNPGDVLKWTAFNNSTVDTVMGVRMSGYLDSTQKRVNTRFGG
jgi:hypothetical protein